MRSPSAPTDLDAGQRMLLLGHDAVSEVELLALILRGGRALPRALDLFMAVGGLAALEGSDPRMLSRVPGIGPKGALSIVAAIELGRRIGRLPVPYAREINGPGDVADYLRMTLGPRRQETFMVLGLDARNRLQIARIVAVGSLATVQVHPREVFRPLIEAGMHSAVLVHNHPSGEVEPSDADIMLTHRFVRVGDLLGIPVLDHLVVTRDAIASHAELGFVGLSPVDDERVRYAAAECERRPWPGGMPDP